MKKHHTLGVLVCAFALVLVGGGMPLAGDGCCVYNEAGECVPCDPASMHASSTTEKLSSPAEAEVIQASAGSTATIPVRVMMPDGSQKVVALPLSLFTGAMRTTACAPGSCGGSFGASAQLTKALLVDSPSGTKTCVPGPCVPGAECVPCPPEACEMIEGTSTTSVPSDI